MAAPQFVFVIVDTPNHERTRDPSLKPSTAQAYIYPYATSIEETVRSNASDFKGAESVFVTTDGRCDKWSMKVSLEPEVPA